MESGQGRGGAGRWVNAGRCRNVPGTLRLGYVKRFVHWVQYSALYSRSMAATSKRIGAM